MLRKTDSDQEALKFQMGRFFSQNGEWYYMTREGDDRGPFLYREDAEGDLVDYIRDQSKRRKFRQ